MSRSDVVDEGYRIQAADLQGKEMEWLVCNISYQGVEEMLPVLHLDGTVKRLVLDPKQSRQMMTLTRSTIPEDWIGAKIRLAPTGAADKTAIAITSADVPARQQRWPLRTPEHKWSARIVYFIVTLAALAALAWFVFRIGFTL